MEREADKLRSTQNLIFGIINVCLFHFWPGGLLMTSSNEKHLFVRKKSFTSWMATEIFPFQSEIVPPKSIQLRKQSMEIPHFLWKSCHTSSAGKCRTVLYTNTNINVLENRWKYRATLYLCTNPLILAVPENAAHRLSMKLLKPIAGALVWDIYANFSLKSKSCIECWIGSGAKGTPKVIWESQKKK